MDDEQLYVDNGYKPIEYKDAPSNIDGYNLVSKWIDAGDKIVQDWTHELINEDYSFRLVQAIGSFCEKNVELRNGVEKNYANNSLEIQSILSKHRLVEFIYKSRDKKYDIPALLALLHVCNLDLTKFLDKLGLIDKISDIGYTVWNDTILRNTKELVENDVVKWLGEEYKPENHPEGFENDPKVLNFLRIIKEATVYPMEVKYSLNDINKLESFSTSSNITTYYMSFIYMFTLFDEVLLKTIRLICMHEKKWLVSNASISAADILDCRTTDELHMKLVDKKIEELAWGGYLDKLKFLESKGIAIDEEHTKLFNETILYLSQKRNAMVHNEGRWNASIKNNLKGTDYFDNVTIGDKVDTSLESYMEASKNVQQAIDYLNKVICDKFNLLYRIDVNYYFKLEDKETDNVG